VSKRNANKRPGADAGWRVSFAFQRPWPRATQADRSATMKTKSFLHRVLIGVAVGFGVLTLLATVQTLGPPPSAEGVWFGYTESRDQFLRLELDKQGVGFLAVKGDLTNYLVHLYRIERWEQKKREIQIGLRPADVTSETIYLKNVKLNAYALDLEVGGKSWERKATLFSEQGFLSLATATKDRIELAKKLTR
jgi:hypothetical protein